MRGGFALALATSLAVAAALSSRPARALEVPPNNGRFVNDHAQLLSPERARALEARLEAHQTSTGQQFLLLTVPSLEGDSIDGFGIRVMDSWKPGSKAGDEGLILIVAAKDRKTRIEVGYGLEGTITDALSSRVINEVIQPAFKAEDYAGGLDNAFTVLMHQAGGGAEKTREPIKKRARPLIGPLLFPLLLFFVFGMLGGGGRRGRRRRGFYVGPGFGGFGGGFGSGGGFSGGGFGGGGFGGGGGGGFSGGGGGGGGGGASGGW